MSCKLCGGKIAMRTIAGITLCEKCFKNLELIRSGDANTIKYFSSPDAYENSTPEAKEYFQSIVGSKVKEIHNLEEKERISKEEQEKLDRFLCTTTNRFENYNIKSYYGPAFGEVVIGTGFLTEIEAGFSDFFGTESWRFSEKINQARTAAMNAMKKQCIEKGANAAVGISFNVAALTSNMFMVCVNGTAVAVEKQ